MVLGTKGIRKEAGKHEKGECLHTGRYNSSTEDNWKRIGGGGGRCSQLKQGRKLQGRRQASNRDRESAYIHTGNDS